MAHDIRNTLNLLAATAREQVSKNEYEDARKATQDTADLIAAKTFGADVIDFVAALKDIPPTDTGVRFRTNAQEQSSRVRLTIELANRDGKDLSKQRDPEINIIVNRDNISCSYRKEMRSSVDDPHLTAESPQQAIEFIATHLVKMAPALCANADKAIPAPGRSGPGGMG